jgi:three-Cys-motif partner protein
VAQVGSPTRKSRPSQQFFRSKRAAAVLKHAILSRYVVPFASKTGSSSPGHRVVIVDGYAGQGRYDSREAGSPALIAAAARTPALRGKNVECIFVEKKLKTFKRLCEVLAEEDGEQVTWEAWHGTVLQHLDELLERASGVPLFLFLDPFGLGLPFDVIASVFSRRAGGRFPPATEVLFRFDAGAIRRIRGVLHGKGKDPGVRAAQIAALDRAAGGTWWWREEDRNLDNTEYVNWFMTRLLRQICVETKCSGWIVQVKQRGGVQPAYYLVFLTRHSDGMEKFAEALSLAQTTWRRAVFDEEAEDAAAHGQLLLPYVDEFFEDQERLLTEQWYSRLEANVRALVTEHDSFVVRDRFSEVFAGVLGMARERHLRVALRRLHAAGFTSSDGAGDLYGKRVIRAGAQPTGTGISS